MLALLLVCGNMTSAQGDTAPTQTTIGPGTSVADDATGLLLGQSFVAPHDGFLDSARFVVCTNSPTQIAVRRASASGEWNSGEIVGISSWLPPISSDYNACTPSVFGISFYNEVILLFPHLPLEAEHTYIFEFTSGFAANAEDEESTGQAFGEFEAIPAFDLAYTFTYSNEDILFGCIEESACDYDSLAEYSNGDCQFIDCHGTCGGTATFIEGCGCRGGDTGRAPESCYGCTDPIACNFNTTASIDNGTCHYPDCAGDCINDCPFPCGERVLSNCGCHTPDQLCLSGCLTEPFGPGLNACTPYGIAGQAFQVEQSGMFKRLDLAVCCAFNTQWELRELSDDYACVPSSWSSGELLYSSSIHYANCPGDGCGPQNFGEKNWTINNDLVLLQGRTYVLRLINGIAAASCDPLVINGHGITGDGTATSDNWAFTVHVCTTGLVAGCTDPSFDNYSATHTHEDGTCQMADCTGTIGGSYSTGLFDGACHNSNDLEAVMNHDHAPGTTIPFNGILCNQENTSLSTQTWTPTHSGWLTEVQLHLDRSTNTELQIRRLDWPYPDSALTSLSHGADTDFGYCDDPNNWVRFLLDSIPIESGGQYQIESKSGSLPTLNCIQNFPEGFATSSGSETNEDWAIGIHLTTPSGDLEFGCKDFGACNYDLSAHHPNNDCLHLDCMGECGGVAVLNQECGCVGGTSERTLDNCYGCMDTGACNYDSSASVPALIDDGSCYFPDCHGDCDGFAVLDPTCGCIGGNTGIGAEDCFDRCQAAPLFSNANQTIGPSGFPYQLLFSNGAVQSYRYVPEETQADSTYLTAIRLMQFGDASDLQIVIAQDDGNGNYLDQDTLSGISTVKYIEGNVNIYDVFFTLNFPIKLSQGEQVFFELEGENWSSPNTINNSLTYGTLRPFFTSQYEYNDLHMKLLACDTIKGCTDENACNFESWAQEGDPAVFCTYTCVDPYASNYDAAADSSCFKNETCTFDNLGCLDAAACNYDTLAPYQINPYNPEDSANCVYEGLNCVVCDSSSPSGYISYDEDEDGVCDQDEVAGCQDEAACNYHSGATDNATCYFQSICNTCEGKDNLGNGILVGNDDVDLDGICDFLDDCADILATNFDANPSEPCVFHCEELPSPLSLTALTLGQIPSAPDAIEGTLNIEYHGGHGDSLAWQATIVDVQPPYDTLKFPLSSTIGPIPPSLYRICLNDGYGCASSMRADSSFFQSHDASLLMTPGPSAGFEIIQPSDSTFVRFAIPYTICD